MGLIELPGVDRSEVGPVSWRLRWLRSGFPRAYLAPHDRAFGVWRRSLVQTFLERDSPQLGITVPVEALRQFRTVLTHCHAQTWNETELARALGSNEGAARGYLNILAGTFVVRALPRWFANVRNRQLRSPRIYVRESGVLHALPTLVAGEGAAEHPRVGASFEGFTVEHFVAAFKANGAYCWATHSSVELQALVMHGGKGFECGLSDAPGTTRSMRVAPNNLALERLWVVYSGHEAYPLADRITVHPIANVPALAQSVDVGEHRGVSG